MLKVGWIRSLFPPIVNAVDMGLGLNIKPEIIKNIKDFAFPTKPMTEKEGMEFANKLLTGDLPFAKDWLAGKEGTFGIDGAINAFVMPLVFSVVYPVLGEVINRYILLKMRPYLQAFRIDPTMAVQLAWRGITAPKEIKNWYEDLKDQGWSQSRIEGLEKVMRPILSVGEIRDLYLRGELGDGGANETECINKLNMLGYDNENATQLRKIFYYIPPPPDMVRMVVREAWREDIAEMYHTDEDYPVDAEADFKKAGVSPEWLKLIWRAHWELPSMMAAFEMFHRVKADSTDPDADIITLPSGATTKNVIGMKTLETLLRTQDVMPFWRDKQVSVAYSPITRVDVRRLYKVGVLDEDEVFIAYINLGYDEINAKRMTDFTIKYYPREENTPEDEAREATKGETLALYREKVITDTEALNMLVSIDYPLELSNLLIALEDIKEVREELRTELGYIDDAYITGTITRGELIDRLGKLNLPATQTDTLIATLDKKKLSKAVRPTVADFKGWLKSKIISVEEFGEEMAVEGYADHYINKYIEAITK